MEKSGFSVQKNYSFGELLGIWGAGNFSHREEGIGLYNRILILSERRRHDPGEAMSLWRAM